ncbi:MAG: hypothetical protein GY828_05900, partial [Candidatus Gracilibacteria bacterium]|nr:hypothetical protein [Candidatus Gracilibacteria bacterium]
MFMKNSTNRNIAERIEAIGYDMMCRIFGRLYTLAKEKRLSDIRYCFWMNLINRAFIDGFHIATHKTDMCENKDGEGAFHPKLSKFKKIFGKKIKVAMNKKVNSQIVEQFWSIIEKATYIRAMCKEKFHFHLFQVMRYHNTERKLQLEREGWVFIPIKSVAKLHTIDVNKLPSLPLKKELIKLCASTSELPAAELEMKKRMKQSLLRNAKNSKHYKCSKRQRRRMVSTSPFKIKEQPAY